MKELFQAKGPNSISDVKHREVLQIILDTWKSNVVKLKLKMENLVYPAHIKSLWIVIGLVIICDKFFLSTSLDVVNLMLKYGVSTGSQLPFIQEYIAYIITGFSYWVMYIISARILLKLLLSYQGFLFESRGRKISMKTKIWGVILKYIVKLNTPRLYSMQNSLPTLPVPKLSDTIEKYLRSVRPLQDDETYERTCKNAQEFEKGVGKKFQRYLILKSWWATNYVSDWWEKYAYLRNRNPLITYSNIYGTDNKNYPTKKQTVRTANLIYQTFKFKNQLEREEISPILIQGMVPLCSEQIRRMFGTARIPGIECDELVHVENSNYLVVLHKGCYYKMPVVINGKLLSAHEIQYQLDYIVRSSTETSHAEKYLASLTAGNRTKWAETRNKYFSSGVNKNSLECIESSAFFLNLHDGPYDMDLDSPEKMKIYSKQCLHGNGFDIWFDKSYCIGAGTNARFTMNAEHSWADAPTLGILFETFFFEDLFAYDEYGNLLKSTETSEKPPLPTRLKWDLANENLVKDIDEAYSEAVRIINEADHFVYKHQAFGKGFIKTCKISPDGFIQMALQLAYYRDIGKFALTYEASMTRLYREGRTETVRSCTIESCAWVKAMEDENFTTKERVELLKTACERHQKGYLEAMSGNGIDRHLFCLFVVSKYLNIESPFLNDVLSEPFLLSTSQTPHGQLPQTDLNKYPQLRGSGGGFGPVFNDGYSVSYIVSGEDNIFFHLSSTTSCPTTNTQRFAQRIEKALLDVKALFEKYHNDQIKN